MITTLLITGAGEKDRKTKALELAWKVSSKFDTKVLDAKSDGSISAVREVVGLIKRKPFNSALNSLLILEGQDLTIEAQNALLKTLEEPPPSTQVILTSATRESLLSTITSRCSLVELSSLGPEGTNLEKIESYLGGSFFDRWSTVDKLDLNSYLAYWRGQLLNSTSKREKELSGKILSHLKLILKVKSLLKQKAAKKLALTLLLLQPPQIQ